MPRPRSEARNTVLRDEDDRFHVQLAAQKRKTDAAARKHAGTVPGNTEPNAGGRNREVGDRKARQNDRATNGGE